jgi:aminoglycoside/choline kinase family phosphotransferase
VNRVAERVEDLTPEWLSDALGVEVRSATAQAIGAGQTGASYRVDLDTDGPPTVVAKLAAGDEASRRRVAPGYRSEVGFYTQLVETLDVRTPRCWYGAISDDAMQFTLLLEDLAPRITGVQANGCSVAQADAALRNLAGLHAPRWNDESLFDLDFLSRTTEARADYLAKILMTATGEFVTRYEAELDSSEVRTLRASASAITEWQLARPEPFAVIHGDYRLDNLMFAPEDDDVVAVDWQTVIVGPPTRDVAYFLGTSLDVEERRAAEEQLVASYHRELCSRGVDGYDLERCFDDYRVGQLQGPMITVIGCMYATATRSDAADRMFLAMIHRACAAIQDLDSISAISRRADGTVSVRGEAGGVGVRWRTSSRRT